MGSYNASTYRPSSFLEKIKYALLKWKDVYQATDGLGKAGMIINLPLPGLGSALLGRLEKGLLAFLAYFAVIFLGVYVAIQKANGVALNEGSLAILYIVLLLAVVFMIASAFGASVLGASAGFAGAGSALKEAEVEAGSAFGFAAGASLVSSFFLNSLSKNPISSPPSEEGWVREP